jgi:hypothetical protein
MSLSYNQIIDYKLLAKIRISCKHLGGGGRPDILNPDVLI